MATVVFVGDKDEKINIQNDSFYDGAENKADALLLLWLWMYDSHSGSVWF